MRALLLVGAAGAAAILHSIRPAEKPTAREVEIVGLDYAFIMPRQLPAGRTTFRLRNAGRVPHEFNIVMLKPGVTIDQFIQAGKENKPRQPMIEGAVGVLFARPGKTSSSGLTTDLVAGRDYAVQCIFRDSAKAPQHIAMGMYGIIRVTRGAPAPAATPADSIIGLDYAYKYPKELSPGRHSLAFRNDGKQRHEIFTALLKQGVTLDSVVAVSKRKGDVFALLEEGLGVLHSRGGELSLGRLDIDFLPGREYLIECGFRDDENSPRHYDLGMYGSIKVPGKPLT
ncbi:MAG TPA: hypothetical protein VIF83_02340 [Gemmatimonadaceae bacterium]